jgi:antitoxin PrlF
MEQEARVTSKGQVTIPKEVRRALRIRAGDTLIFETDEEGVRIRPLRPANAFVEYEGVWREGEGETAEEINARIRELRDPGA